MSIYEERDWVTDLATAWENAEPGIPAKGDIVIVKSYVGGYHVRPAHEALDQGARDRTRILKRAPKPEPKPRVVMASWVHDADRREAYTLQPDGEWESLQYAIEADGLVDPVEMVELPSFRELSRALIAPYFKQGSEWPGTDALAEAVLELLKGGA